MPSHNQFVDFAVEQMQPLGAIRARAMFGGYGVYDGDLMFAVIIDDALYLKADAITRADFDALGLRPFHYEARGRSITLGYYEAPPAVFEERDVMRTWIGKARDAALRAAKAKKVRKRAAPRRK